MGRVKSAQAPRYGGMAVVCGARESSLTALAFWKRACRRYPNCRQARCARYETRSGVIHGRDARATLLRAGRWGSSNISLPQLRLWRVVMPQSWGGLTAEDAETAEGSQTGLTGFSGLSGPSCCPVEVVACFLPRLPPVTEGIRRVRVYPCSLRAISAFSFQHP